MQKIKKVAKHEAVEIIKNRMPFGKFWLKRGEKYIGIDNTSADAWVEEFSNKNKLMKWLSY